MLVYLNGVSDIDTLGGIRIPLPKAVQKIIDNSKKLVPPVILKNLVKIEANLKQDLVIAQQKVKEQAAKIKAGLQRLASLPQQLVNKAALQLISKNFMDLAVRIRDGYHIDPVGLKNIISMNKIPWSDFTAAVNKGTKGVGAISGRINDHPDDYDAGSGNTGSGGSQPSASQYEAWTKAAVGFIKQIVAWFKKIGKHKSTDDQVINQMAAEVDVDPTIPKYDENGNLLPNADGSYPPVKKAGVGTVLALAAAGIGAKVLLFS